MEVGAYETHRVFGVSARCLDRDMRAVAGPVHRAVGLATSDAAAR